MGNTINFFHDVKTIHTTRGQKREEFTFLCSKIVMLDWDPNH